MIKPSISKDLVMTTVRNAIAFGALLLISVAALAGDLASQVEVKVVLGGSVVAKTLLPSDSDIRVTASSISGPAPGRVAASGSKTTAVGHAILVASQDGKVFITLTGDQLELTKSPQ